MSQRFQVLELTRAPIARAAELARRHFLRAADAIQLAAALISAAGHESGSLTVVSSDRELNAASEGEGLSVLDPTEMAGG